MCEPLITACVSKFPDLHDVKLAPHQDMTKIYTYLLDKISTCTCRCQVCLKNPETEELTASSVGIVARGRYLDNRESRLVNTVDNTEHAPKACDVKSKLFQLYLHGWKNELTHVAIVSHT